MEEHKDNKPQDECRVCSGQRPACNVKTDGTLLSWDCSNCQKICPEICKNYGCNNNGVCCAKSCLGGCDDEDISQCKVCQYVVENSSQQCVEKCPPDTYKYMDRKCLTANECLELPRDNYTMASFFPLDDVCKACPFGSERNEEGICQPAESYAQDNKEDGPPYSFEDHLQNIVYVKRGI